MRSYAHDSARACARIVVMTVLADGVPDKSELVCLKRPEGLRSLEISAEVFDEVMQAYCEDLEQSIGWFDALRGNLRPEFIDVLLDEVSDSQLQQRLLALMLRLVTADGCLSEGESTVLSRARQRWGLAGRWPIRVRPSSEYHADMIV